MLSDMYRVVETVTAGFTNPTTTQNVLWRGTDLNKLKQQFPIDDILGDPLSPYTTNNDYIRHDFRFERHDVIDVWVRCDDPRPPVPETNPDSFEEDVNLFNCGALVLGRLGMWT